MVHYQDMCYCSACLRTRTNDIVYISRNPRLSCPVQILWRWVLCCRFFHGLDVYARRDPCAWFAKGQCDPPSVTKVTATRSTKK